MKNWVLLAFVLCVSCASAQRVQLSFNNDWQFLQNKTISETIASQWKPVTLPHTWNLDAYEQKDYTRDACWYRKIFSIPAALKNKTLYLRFEAVNSYAAIYLNGQLLATHSGGYSAFHVQLPAALLKGNDTLQVLADNRNKDIPPLSGDFTIFGGIYRNVWLVATDKTHFDSDNYGSPGIFISTPVVSNTKARIRVKGAVRNATKDCAVQLKISLGGKHILTKKISLKDNDSLQPWYFTGLEINNPQLWSPDSPNLYTATLQLIRKKKTIDEAIIPFGLRWFSADTRNGFLLNGRPIKLMGTNRHQDKAPYGIAVPDKVHREDMRLIKSMGVNFVRLAHYQQSDEVLKSCDSLGLLVWEEIPVVDIIGDNDTFKTNAKSQLTEMIRQHYNHPSVIFWGYMNEILLQVERSVAKEQRENFYTKTLALARELEQLLKREDSSRLSIMAYHGTDLYNRIGLSDITDVSGWNLYQGWYGGDFSGFEKFADEQHRRYPQKPIIISEFGAGSDKRLHSLQPETFDFSIEYQQKYLEHYLPQIMARPYIIGATEWNFIDFNVATRQESMPRTNNKGLVYNDRSPKDVFYYFKAFLRKDSPVIHIAVDDWAQRTAVSDTDTAAFPIKVYANLPQLALRVNGVLLPTLTLDNFTAVWNVYLHKGNNIIEAIEPGETTKLLDKKNVQLQILPFTTAGKKLSQNIIAVNAGSNCDFITDSLTFVADRPYKEGSWGYTDGTIFRKSPGRIGTTAEIMNTAYTPLFQTKREDISAYKIDVPPGRYEIELGFADLYNAPQKQAYDLSVSAAEQAGLNVFDVLINDSLVLQRFSPYQLAGNNAAVIRKFVIDHTTNSISIRFRKISGHTFLNYLKLRLPSPN
ncbi:MAG: glycoside hydrolase family 2 TIM barrel-domain containing protein [Ferruginibacter sp.]